MIWIFLLVLISVFPLPEIAEAAESDGSPMLVLKTTLKTWHSMYNSYREEVNLGYCWADYFFDVKRVFTALTGPRFLGINPEDQTPLVMVLKNWFNPEGERKSVRNSTDDEEPLVTNKNHKNYTNNDDDGDHYGQDYYPQGTGNPQSEWYVVDGDNNAQKISENGEIQAAGNEEETASPYTQVDPNSSQYFYPGIYKRFDNGFKNYERSLSRGDSTLGLTALEETSKARSLSDIFISILGLNVPPGLGPLMLGVQQPSAIVIVISRIIGTFMRVGRQVLETIETTSILACTKEYLLVKIFRWIDS